jgi:hypothetical protein
MTTILIIVVSIITLLLLVALAMSKDLNIECNITINKPANQIFNYVKLSKNHDNFSTWNMMDKEMKKTYTGTDGEVGFIYAWDSSKNKNVGAGEQEIITLEQNKLIAYDIRFTRPMQSIAKAKYVFTSNTENQTNVMWGFYSQMSFPMNIMKPIFKKMMGKALDKGLQNLKVIMEK